MLKIGDFSKLSRVTVKALRHYERLVYIRTPEADPEAPVPMVEVQLPIHKTD